MSIYSGSTSVVAMLKHSFIFDQMIGNKLKTPLCFTNIFIIIKSTPGLSQRSNDQPIPIRQYFVVPQRAYAFASCGQQLFLYTSQFYPKLICFHIVFG